MEMALVVIIEKIRKSLDKQGEMTTLQ